MCWIYSYGSISRVYRSSPDLKVIVLDDIVLRTSNLHYTYPDGARALNGINFEARRCKKTAIIGPNGSGKSTLFLHFNGLYRPTAGAVYVNGAEITDKNIDTIRRTVGLVFQDPDDQLFAPTVRDDVAFGPANLGLSRYEIETRVEDVLTMLGISDLRDRNVDNLSGGQKKTVAIAGVLAMEPDIIVLDEPTSGLDPESTTEIVEITEELTAAGKSIIISTHDVDLALSWADEIYVLKSGTVYRSGTPREIFGDKKLIGETKLRFPTVTKTFIEFKNRKILDCTGCTMPRDVLDLVDGFDKNEHVHGRIDVIRVVRGTIDMAAICSAVRNRDFDRIGAMGTASKAVAVELGITCDYSTDVIQSAISAAVRGLNVLVLASGGMADLVLSRVSERNTRDGQQIECEIIL
ncbi:ATP-binding cassette domain-containing protein [ANME-2 cluster archaeon]|nr:MAG: ATP-binding cassette domain-containing protein [ANME-2 cluster archaeon]